MFNTIRKTDSGLFFFLFFICASVVPAHSASFGQTISFSDHSKQVHSDHLDHFKPNLDSLTATLSGGGEICQGGSGADLIFTFTGSGPYTFVYAIIVNGVPQPQAPITTAANPYILHVNPPNGTFYTLVSVSNAAGPGSVSGQVAVLVFTPPTANLSGSAVFCDSAKTNLMVDFTGTGPFTLTYTKDGILQAPINTFDDPLLIPVNLSNSSTYMLSGVSSPGCTGVVSGIASITIHYTPTYANITYNCNLIAHTYTVEFDVLNAQLPLTLVSGTGTFNGSHFTSAPIDQANGYNFSFHDVNNCNTVNLNGTVDCSCKTMAGTVNLSPIFVCANDTAKIKHQLDFVSDGNDSLRFILHTTPGIPLGNILAWSQIPEFVLGPNLQTGVTYYVSPIAGNPDGLGKIDLNDPCLSVGQGVALEFYPLPSAILSQDTTTCKGNPVSFTVNFTGAPPFTLQYALNGVSQTQNNLAGPGYQIDDPGLMNTLVVLNQVNDLNCASLLSDSAQLTVFDKPSIQNLMYLCNFVTGTYTLTFDCLGTEPFTVNGISGTFNGNKFTSVPVLVGLPYNITLSDSGACGQDAESGTPICTCNTQAGVLTQAPQNLCYGQPVSIPPANGVVLEPGDTLVYALVNKAFNIVASNTSPSFAFDPLTMFPDSTYLVVGIAGELIGNMINFSDPCLSIASGPYVTWLPPVSATLSGDTVVCKGASTQLRIDFKGKGPYKLTYNDNGSFKNLSGITLNPYLLDLVPAVAGSYSLVNVFGANGCQGAVQGTANIKLSAQPEILDLAVDCDFNTATYTLAFNIGNGPDPNAVYAVTGLTGVLSDTSFLSTSMPKDQPYQVTVTNVNGCSTSISGKSDCVCPTFSGTLNNDAISLCLPDSTFSVLFKQNAKLDPDDILRFVLCKDTAQLPASILQISDSPDFNLVSGMQAGEIYYVVAVAGTGNNGNLLWTDPCLSISPKTRVQFFTQPMAEIDGDTSICRGNGLSFKIHFTGTPPFKFVYAINNVPQAMIVAPNKNFNISTNNVQEMQNFTLLWVEDAHCPGTVSGVYHVGLLPETSATLAGDATVCPGDSATLQLFFSGADSFDVVITDGLLPFGVKKVKNGANIGVLPAGTSNYWIESYSAYGNTCLQKIQDTILVSVDVVKAQAEISRYGAFGVRCAGAQDGFIHLSKTQGIAPFSAMWDNGNTGLSLDNLTAGSYQVTLSDQVGCTFTDVFLLEEPDTLQFAFSIQQPNCADRDQGILTLQQVSGGAGSYKIGLDGMPLNPIGATPAVFALADPGLAVVRLEDSNGCFITQVDTVDEIVPLLVDLGPDQTIQYGDSLLLQASVSGGSMLNLISWSPLTELSDPKSLETYVKPERSIQYEIRIQDTMGCKASDRILVSVDRRKRVFLPNAVDPEAQSPNNYFTVYGGNQVVRVQYLRIYDRWGSLLFENQDISPNIPELGWDGTDRGHAVTPGVYAYETKVLYRDGQTEVFVGDVTVLK